MPQLFTESLPALSGSERAPDLLLIHGWGHDSEIWRPFLPQLRSTCNVILLDLPGFGRSSGPFPHDLSSLLERIAAAMPAQLLIGGFSLGGMLAMQLAARYPERVAAVISFASNLRFVACNEWQAAMPAAVFASFAELVASQPALASKRFTALQARGADNEKALMKQLRLMQTDELAATDLSASLTLLSQLDNRQIAKTLQVPVLHLLAANDSLVPVAVSQSLCRRPDQQVHIIEGASHPMFLTHSERCWSLIQSFLAEHQLLAESASRRLDKRRVAQSFSRAAASYDAVAQLQRQVAEQLLATLDAGEPSEVTSVVDLGCGTGFCLGPLSQRFAPAGIVGLDLAEGMLAYIRHRHQSAPLVCADAENLPLADSSVDVVFSNLAIQWCEDTHALMSEVHRVLRPSGRFVFSTLGPDTLHELRMAWQSVDDFVHVNQFLPVQSLLAAADSAGFPALQLAEQMMTLRYDSVKSSLAALKDLGAHNINDQSRKGLTGRKHLLAFREAYEKQRDAEGFIPASYQVWYGSATKAGGTNGR